MIVNLGIPMGVVVRRGGKEVNLGGGIADGVSPSKGNIVVGGGGGSTKEIDRQLGI